MAANVARRLVRAGVRGVGRLPEPVLRALAGPAHVVDGQRLYPEVQLALRVRRGVRDAGETVEHARARVAREAWLLGSAPRVGLVVEVTVPGSRGPVPARLYQADPGRRPDGVVVYFHGGGWVVGDLDTADPICRAIAVGTNLAVLSVDYALAPEHPFPAAVGDAVEAFRWARDDAALWRPDVRLPVAVAGDSAGGTLAAVVSNLTRDDDGGGPVFQLLLYPGADFTRDYPSASLFDGYALPADRLSWYSVRYLPDDGLKADPRVSPLLSDDLAGVAPAHVAVAGFDVLRDEGLAYADRLRDSGVPVTTQVVEGHVHAWANATGASRRARAALADAVARLDAGVRAAGAARVGGGA